MSIHKWQKELEEALTYKHAIILYNNVRDKYLYQNPSTPSVFDFLALKEYLVKFLKTKFRTLKVYDPIKGVSDYSEFSDLPKNEKIQSKSKENDNEQTKMEPDNKKIASVKADTKPNVEGDIEDIRKELTSQNNCCYIIQYADKTFPEKASSQDEQRLIQRLEKIIENMQSDNKLILVFLTQEQIPPELYKNHPKTKLINISNPERSDFKILFKKYKEDDKEVGELVNTAEGLKFLEVEQIILSAGSLDNISKFKETVRKYKFGEVKNYWEEVTWDKIQNLFSSFTKETEGGRGPITGQDEGIRKAESVVKSAVADIQRITGGNPLRPRATLFFAGPTGVGKTLTAQKLAIFLFGSEDKLLRFDMSEYKHDFQVSRLYGAPPGYVGHESGGTLTNAVKEKPFSVILFDEIEKAHPQVLDIFLQILSDGRLTDSRGETVYFSESMIIFTSNIGTRTENKNGDKKWIKIGERKSGDKKEDILGSERELLDRLRKEGDSKIIEEHFKTCVKNYFENEISRPELFNRIGVSNIVVFNYIDSPENTKQMITNYLSTIKEEFNKSCKDRMPSLQLEIDINEITEYIFSTYQSDIISRGGREVVNIIDAYIRDKIAREIIDAQGSYRQYPHQKEKIIKITIEDGGLISVLI